MLKNDNIKGILSIGSFISSILIGFIALFLPPQGLIDSSVLWFTAQLLCFTSGMLGVNFSIDSLKRTAKTNRNEAI